MAPDAAPPVIITAAAAAATAATAEPSVTSEEVYGPVDTEARSQPAAVECPQPSGDEILVCAKVDSNTYRTGVITPPPKTAMQEVGEALNVKNGNIEVGSIDRGDGTRGWGLRLKF